MSPSSLLESCLFIGAGLSLSLPLLLGSMSIGLVLGCLFALSLYQGRARFILIPLLSLIRGTPMILQISFVYFSLPLLIHYPLSILEAGIISLGLNSSAYVAEIIRAGLSAIPRGQFEAAQTLYIPRRSLWMDIILPQVFRIIFPALMNEWITLLKDTALISTIGGLDIMRRAQMISAEHFSYFYPLCIAAIYYYLLVLLFETLARRLEKRMALC